MAELFDKHTSTYTDEGKVFASEVIKTLEGFFQMEYSPLDVAILIIKEVTTLCNETILKRMMK